jgi:hypothetical protein
VVSSVLRFSNEKVADLRKVYWHDLGQNTGIHINHNGFGYFRVILTNRCAYFEMMLGGDWAESTAQTVKLER